MIAAPFDVMKVQADAAPPIPHTEERTRLGGVGWDGIPRSRTVWSHYNLDAARVRYCLDPLKPRAIGLYGKSARSSDRQNGIRSRSSFRQIAL
jgi:hypothetical protein